MADPKDHLQTHDGLGRQFTEPMTGGPVQGKLNVTIGEAKTGDIIVSLQDDTRTLDLFVEGSGTILDVLRPLTDKLEPYAAEQAYWSWFKTFIGDLPIDQAIEEIHRLCAEAGLNVDSFD